MKTIKAIYYSIVPSPYQRDLFYQLSCLPELDIKVYYLEPGSPDSPWPSKSLQPYEHILPGSQYISWSPSQRFLFNRHWPNLNDTDIVVVNGYNGLVPQVVMHYWAKRIPCIFWGEKISPLSSGLRGKLQYLLKQGLQHCQAIAAIGSLAQEDYRKYYPHKPVFNIPYYCDLSEFMRDRPSRPRDPITILFCGQMIYRKGVDLLLKSFEKVIHAGYHARLLLIGIEAELPEMMANIADPVKQWICYAGFQAPSDLPKYFRQADIFVLPSRYDGWGVVVNQALGAGLPLICSDQVGAAYDLIDTNHNGYIFPNGDLNALTNAIIDYIAKPNLLKFSSESSYQRASLWSPEFGAKQWVDTLQQFI